MLTTLLTHLILFVCCAVQGRRKPPAKANHVTTTTEDNMVLGHELPLEAANDSHSSPTADAPILTQRDLELGRHCGITGPSGGGKTNTIYLLVEATMHAQPTRKGVKPNLVVFDARGTMASAILSRFVHSTRDEDIATASEKLVWLDLGDPDFVACHNPLEHGGKPLPRDAAHRAAMFLAGLIKKNAESWGVQIEETINMSLAALALSGHGPHSLLDLWFLLSDASLRSHILAKVEDGFILNWFANFDALSHAKQEAIRQPIFNKCSPFLGFPRARCLNGSRVSSFNFSDLVNHPAGGRTIYISLAAGSLPGSSDLFGEMLMEAFLQNAIFSRADQPESERVPTFLIVDEFQSFMPHCFLEAFYEARKFRLGIVASHQNLQQLPTDLQHALRSNSKTLLVHQGGPPDVAELSREIVTGGVLSTEEIRQALLTMPVGRCFWTERGRNARFVQMRHSLDPVADPARIQAIKRGSQQRYCRPRVEVEAEIDARLAASFCTQSSNATGANPTISEEGMEARMVDVEPRHGKGRKYDIL